MSCLRAQDAHENYGGLDYVTSFTGAAMDLTLVGVEWPGSGSFSFAGISFVEGRHADAKTTEDLRVLCVMHIQKFPPNASLPPSDRRGLPADTSSQSNTTVCIHRSTSILAMCKQNETCFVTN